MRGPRVAIVGAGPHGLSVALHLLQARPELRDGLMVFDPAGAWMERWRRASARLQIDVLRSPSVHHPGVAPHGLARFQRDRQLPTSGLDHDLPRRDVFEAYCDHLVHEAALDDAVIEATVLLVVARGRALHLQTTAGDFAADEVIVAANPHRRQLPGWLAHVSPRPSWQLAHADDIDLDQLCPPPHSHPTSRSGRSGHTDRSEHPDRSGPPLRASTIAVIGGGLTAAHLALGAARAGAAVHLLSRRPLRTSPFDVEPGWLGPRYLDAFDREPSPLARARQAAAARDGGSIPPWMVERLAVTAGRHRLRIQQLRACRSLDGRGERIVFDTTDGATVEPDRIWFATGTSPSLDGCRWLRPLLADIPAVGELPVPDAGLRVGPYRIRVTGRLAALQLGPAAGGLWGARRAALAITRAITGRSLELERRDVGFG